VHVDEHGAHVGHAAGVVAVLVLRAHAEVRQAGAVAAAAGLGERVGAGAHVVVRPLVEGHIVGVTRHRAEGWGMVGVGVVVV